MNERNNIKAFTLAEVLITLMVIGVLAITTIPSLLQSWEERATVSKLRKTYSALQQAFKLAELENGPVNTWTMNTSNAFEFFLPYLPVQKYCSNKPEGCFINEMYKKMDGNDYTGITTETFEASNACNKIVLVDGVSMFISSVSHCTNFKTNGYSNCAILYVDINGQKSPNTLGKDMFCFSITKIGIIPWGGITETNFNAYGHNYCLAANATGWGCARWVIERGNMDYLHKTTTW